MPNPDIIVIGASAGGVEALGNLTANLPPPLPAAVFVVLHIPTGQTSYLTKVLARRSLIPVRTASDEMPIQRGTIYVAPADYHMILGPDKIWLTRGPKENGHRPCIDALFRSAAMSYGSRVISVVLTGNLDDGTLGTQLVRRYGGYTLAQNPEEALYASMPSSAIRYGGADQVISLAELPDILAGLTTQNRDVLEGEANQEGQMLRDEQQRHEEAQAETLPQATIRESRQHPEQITGEGRLSGFSCPDCHGALWELEDGELIRFRCRIGHSYTEEILLHEQDRSVEAALWTAVVALEERAAFLEGMSQRAFRHGNTFRAGRLSTQIKELQARAETIKTVLRDQPSITDTE